MNDDLFYNLDLKTHKYFKYFLLMIALQYIKI